MIDVIGDCAVAECRWEIRYEMDGQEYSEEGYDLFALVRGEQGWKAVWRGVQFESRSDKIVPSFT